MLRGLTYLLLLSIGLTVASQFFRNFHQAPFYQFPVCKTPVAIVENTGEQLGCASELPCTQVFSGDSVQVFGTRCKVTPHGMSGSMRFAAGLKINVNGATPEDFALLNGIGLKVGQAIVDYRLEHGAFDTTRDLGEVHGVGLATLQKLLPYVTVE